MELVVVEYIIIIIIKYTVCVKCGEVHDFAEE
jgi:hypothetical protein